MSTLPEPPYYSVIFPNQHSGKFVDAYNKMADEMARLAEKQPGFLGIHSARNPDGFGITVSYWADEPSILRWKQDVDHLAAQQSGIDQWYDSYEVIIAKVERNYSGPAGRSPT